MRRKCDLSNPPHECDETDLSLIPAADIKNHSGAYAWYCWTNTVRPETRAAIEAKGRRDFFLASMQAYAEGLTVIFEGDHFGHHQSGDWYACGEHRAAWERAKERWRVEHHQ